MPTPGASTFSEPASDEIALPGRLVCVGTFGAPHGVRGLVKLQSYCIRAGDIVHYNPLYSRRGGQRFELEIVAEKADFLVVGVSGINSREEAGKLTHTRLYALRKLFPELEEDSFYVIDLIGLQACNSDGLQLGRIKSVYNFGAGDLLELRLDDGTEVILPFNRDNAPMVMVEEGQIVIDNLAAYR